MSTYTHFKVEIVVAPPASIDTSTHPFKDGDVTAPPPRIEMSTQKFEGGDRVVPPSSIPLLLHPGLQVELRNSLNHLHVLIFFNKILSNT